MDRDRGNIDWRRRLAEALADAGRALVPGEFYGVIDRHSDLEHRPPFRTYREIAARSLVDVFRLDRATADAIGERVGTWPAFPDS